MKKVLLLLAACYLGANQMSAQDTKSACGMSAADQMLFDERLLNNIEKMRSGQVVRERGAIQYVPVHFHLVGDAQGAGRVKESRVLDQLCALNKAYEAMDIRFYLRPHQTLGTLFNYNINSANVYTNQTSWLTMYNNRHTNALNVFVVDEAVPLGSTGGDDGEILGYYNPTRDWVVCKRSRVNGSASNSTLPHEVGHFFSLKHTFVGWEGTSFGPGSAGWPTAPTSAPDGTPTERMNELNCTAAADKLCDTPPDYNFGYGNSGCTYDEGAKDPLGVLVETMENNMMGYFESCNPYEFTQEQQNVILADRASTDRNYLNNNFAPIATEITTPANLLNSPANGATTAYYDQVLLEWKPVTGATYYLVEVDFIFAYNSPTAQSFVVSSTSKLITGLDPDKTYYWRVRPFNEYVTCAESRQQSFKTSITSAIRDIEGLTALQVAPNPVRDGLATLFVHAERDFEANLQVFDATGRQVYTQTGLNFANGESTVELPITGLQNGLYFVMLQSNEGRAVRKFTVLR